MASLAHEFAIENEHITADSVEVSEFGDMAQRYRISGVPKIVINEKVEFVGAQPEARFVQYVLQAVAKGKGGSA